jgi:very-short-patch-repair endonuclease
MNVREINAKARQLRRSMTLAERTLWRVIRDKQINDSRFRRQRPIGKYIVDFVCLEVKLILEVDGGQHASQVEYDAVRTAFLESLGYRVLRFWNNDVLQNTDGVATVILGALEKGIVLSSVEE